MTTILLLEKGDVADFRETLLAHLPAYYDDVDTAMVNEYVRCHLRQCGHGLTTTGVEIWKAEEQGQRAGYLVLVWKRWGTLKIGPCIVSEQYRGKGIGRLFQRLVLRRTQESGVRKVFATLPVGARSLVKLAVEAGFAGEALLRRHYGARSDELVVGRIMKRSRRRERELQGVRELLFTRKGRMVVRGQPVWDVAQSPCELARVQRGMQGVLPAFFADADRRFVEAWCGMRRGFAEEGRSLVVVRDGGGQIVDVAHAARKRGRLLKVWMMPLVDAADVHDAAFMGARELGRGWGLRKLSCEVPSVATASLALVLRGSRVLEGVLKSPYQEGADVWVVADWDVAR